MRPQDVVVLLKKISPAGYQMNGKQLAKSLGISPSEVSEAMNRNHVAGLVDKEKKNINTLALKEFVVNGLKYCFPAELGPVVRGVPTASSCEPFSRLVAQGSDVFVWTSPVGTVRGQEVSSLYGTVPEAALKDNDFHILMAIVDVLRIGRAREKEMAISELDKYLDAYVARS